MALSTPTQDFSLVLGGPLYQMFLRARLVRPPADFWRRRIVAFVLITWVPLLLLALASGSAFSGMPVPFLLDLDVHVRFLIALPLLIIAEVVVHRRLRVTVGQFVERGVVPPEHVARFRAIIDSTMRLRNSVPVEVVLLLSCVTLGDVIWRGTTSLRIDTWYFAAGDAGGAQSLTVAGWWYAFISLNVFRFLLLRWYFRLILWYVFLWQVARLPLRLNALHPDGAAGLGFLEGSAFALLPLLLAHTVTLSGVIGGSILHEGAQLPAFQLEIGASVALLMAAALAPLTFFMMQIAHAKRAAAREYGVLASRYVEEFRAKWLKTPRRDDEPLMGSADLQSLADLGGAHEVLRSTGYFPFGRRTLVRLATLTALPFAPLLLTLIPFEELVQRVLTKMI